MDLIHSKNEFAMKASVINFHRIFLCIRIWRFHHSNHYFINQLILIINKSIMNRMTLHIRKLFFPRVVVEMHQATTKRFCMV